MKCPGVATYRVYWPGKDEALTMCALHAAMAKGITHVLDVGMAVEEIKIEDLSDDVTCNQEVGDGKFKAEAS